MERKNVKVLDKWVAIRDSVKKGNNFFTIGKDLRKPTAKGKDEPEIIAVVNPSGDNPIHFGLDDLLFGLSQLFGKEVLAKMLDVPTNPDIIESKKGDGKKQRENPVWIPEVNPDVITIYSDGAVSGNGTPDSYGGWGAVMLYKGKEKEAYGSVNEPTTNQRTELLAAIIPLEEIKTTSIPIEVYTDSAYLYHCFQNDWREVWEKNGWITSDKKPVANRDLWERLFAAIDRQRRVKFFKVKGHAGIPLNERADKLALKGKEEAKQKRGL